MVVTVLWILGDEASGQIIKSERKTDDTFKLGMSPDDAVTIDAIDFFVENVKASWSEFHVHFRAEYKCETSPLNSARQFDIQTHCRTEKCGN